MNSLKLIILSFFSTIVYFQCTQQASESSDSTDKVEEPLDSATIQAMDNYKNFCSSCHGEQMMAFADRRWKHGKEKDSIFKSIKFGYPETDMIAWKGVFSDEEINNLVDYIYTGIENVERYGFQEATLESDTFDSELVKVQLDTVASEMTDPWGMAFLPSGEILVTQQSGELYKINEDGERVEVGGTPKVMYKSQGGLLDIELHPDFENNRWIYLSYSDYKVVDGDTLSGTAVSRYTYDGSQLANEEKVFAANPYTKRRHHYGSRIEFDQQGYLYVSVGDRGQRNDFPQSLNNTNGKIHRILDDGSIPEDNPFVGQDSAIASIYSFGHRNPQGVALDPSTNKIWTHEHGPRGGDEVNLIEKGMNYGWPRVSYGINYDGTTFTDKLDSSGTKQPELYWVPSIAPCGMTFVNTDKYPGWEGDLLVGSLRFKYLNRCKIENGKIVGEEILLKNIGRLRNVRVAPDGYIYVAVEEPGYVFRLMPI